MEEKPMNLCDCSPLSAKLASVKEVHSFLQNLFPVFKFSYKRKVMYVIACWTRHQQKLSFDCLQYLFSHELSVHKD